MVGPSRGRSDAPDLGRSGGDGGGRGSREDRLCLFPRDAEHGRRPRTPRALSGVPAGDGQLRRAPAGSPVSHTRTVAPAPTPGPRALIVGNGHIVRPLKPNTMFRLASADGIVPAVPVEMTGASIFTTDVWRTSASPEVVEACSSTALVQPGCVFDCTRAPAAATCRCSRPDGVERAQDHGRASQVVCSSPWCGDARMVAVTNRSRTGETSSSRDSRGPGGLQIGGWKGGWQASDR